MPTVSLLLDHRAVGGRNVMVQVISLGSDFCTVRLSGSLWKAMLFCGAFHNDEMVQPDECSQSYMLTRYLWECFSWDILNVCFDQALREFSSDRLTDRDDLLLPDFQSVLREWSGLPDIDVRMCLLAMEWEVRQSALRSLCDEHSDLLPDGL